MFHLVTDSPTKATASDSLRMNFLYYRTTMKILWKGFLARAGSILGTRVSLFLLSTLLFTCPNILWAQEIPWPWRLLENLQITRNLEDDILPSIAVSPNLYLIVWTRKTPSGFRIYGARIRRDGTVLDEDGIPISGAGNDNMFPTLTWDGHNFFVVWQQKSQKKWDIYGARVSPDGKVLDPDGILIASGKSSNENASPVVSSDGQNHLVVWQGKRSSKVWNIYFRRVSKTGEILDDAPVPLCPKCPSLSDQTSPAVAFDGTNRNHFVVWQDSRDGRWDIYGARITASGEILDPGGVLISPTNGDEETGGDKWKPAVSWDENLFLIVWVASRDGMIWSLEGKRITSEGRLIDPIDIRIMKDGTDRAFPAVLWDGKEHLLVWEEDPAGESTIFGASILSTYIAYKPFEASEAMKISFSGMQDSLFPKIARIEDEAIVVWQGLGPDGYWQIYGRRLEKVLEIGKNGTTFE